MSLVSGGNICLRPFFGSNRPLYTPLKVWLEFIKLELFPSQKRGVTLIHLSDMHIPKSSLRDLSSEDYKSKWKSNKTVIVSAVKCSRGRRGSERNAFQSKAQSSLTARQCVEFCHRWIRWSLSWSYSALVRSVFGVALSAGLHSVHPIWVLQTVSEIKSIYLILISPRINLSSIIVFFYRFSAYLLR